jgi:2-haloacid dehalogenase
MPTPGASRRSYLRQSRIWVAGAALLGGGLLLWHFSSGGSGPPPAKPAIAAPEPGAEVVPPDVKQENHKLGGGSKGREMPLDRVKVLAFDVFGTVVDVRGSLLRELSEFGARRGLKADWPGFADRWLSGYAAGVAEVRDGRRAWEPVDALNRSTLDRLLTDQGLGSVTDPERVWLNNAWLRLAPWPDSLEGLRRLRGRRRIVALANGNYALLRDLAAVVGLPWDEILSAESVRRYKPDPAVYRMAVDRLHLAADEIMMVAAHKYDLEAAAAAGLRTAFVPRPLELGPGGHPDQPAPEDRFDLVADDFIDLATKLGT